LKSHFLHFPRTVTVLGGMGQCTKTY